MTRIDARIHLTIISTDGERIEAAMQAAGEQCETTTEDVRELLQHAVDQIESVGGTAIQVIPEHTRRLAEHRRE